MFNYAVFAAAYVLFHMTHGIADYWLQTHYQANNKGKSWSALSRHILSYTLSFLPALSLLPVSIVSWKGIGLLLSIGLPHMFMDRRTFLTWFNGKTKGWKAPSLKPLDKRYVQHDEDGYERDRPLGWPELYGIEQAVKVHVTIEMDQKFHYLCLGLTALWIAWSY